MPPDGHHWVAPEWAGGGGGMRLALRLEVAKPYDIRERAFGFACDAVAAFPARRVDVKTQRIWLQFVAAATSGGAHLEEADAASSRAHFITLNRGALRELRAAKYWIRLIAATGLDGADKAAPLISEASELFCLLPFAFSWNAVSRLQPVLKPPQIRGDRP